MSKYILSMLLICVASLQAVTIDELVDKSLASHTTLKVIKERLKSADESIKMSRYFTNPELSFSVNDILLDDPLYRSKEPMQTASLSFKQKLFWFGKRDASTDVAKAKKASIYSSLESAKVELARSVRVGALELYEAEETFRILQEYRRVIEQNIELHSSYTSTRSGSHMGLMSAELTLSQIKIRLERTSSLIDNLKASLRYLTALDVERIDMSSKIRKPDSLQSYKKVLQNNKAYQLKLKKSALTKAQVAYQTANMDADPFVKLSYTYRDGFDDYVSFNIGTSLPIYGSEQSLKEIATHRASEASLQAQDLYLKLESTLAVLHKRLLEAYSIVNILDQDSLPQLEHMFDLSSSKISSGSDLFVYIDLLKQKLTLDEQLIVAKSSYYKIEAQLKALTGEIR